MTLSLPLFYFKPTICWIDDDQIFLDAINISFKKQFNCLMFNEPKKVIEYFLTYESPISKFTFKHEFLRSNSLGDNDKYSTDKTILYIKDMMSSIEKAEEIAVLVIDYNMPSMNGLELCKLLKHSPVKKVLLTGDVLNEHVIEALANRIINKFIKKDQNISENLQCYINKLTYEYFHDKSTHLFSHIEASMPSLLSDQYFIACFDNWRTANDIVEFHLINKHGEFLVKDKKGKISYYSAMANE